MEARAFAAELTGTFTLVLEAIHTAAIGRGGPLTGASLNPARTLLGAALAGGLYRGLPRGVQP